MSLSLALVLIAGAQAAPPAAQGTPDPKDADPMVCEKVEVTGSRIGSKKVCMRKSQWAEQRNDDKMLIDRSQTIGCQQGTGC